MTSPKCDNGSQDNSQATEVVETTEMKPPQEVQVDQKRDFLQVPPFKGRRFHRKRRHSTSEDLNGNGNKKHRRQPSGHHKKGTAGDIILPTNFLLGGNISDPLNLNSLLDEKVNKALNAVTPTSSPLPPRSSTVNIVIPSDMTDPLGLNSSRDSSKNGLQSAANDSNSADVLASGDENKQSAKKRRKRRKSLHEKKIIVDSNSDKKDTEDKAMESTTGTMAPVEKSDKQTKKTPCELTLPGHSGNSDALSVSVHQVVDVDPIVSPVIPQDIKSNSASKQRKKRSSVICGKQLAFSSGGNEKALKNNSNHNDDMLLATSISDQEKLNNSQSKTNGTAEVLCKIAEGSSKNNGNMQEKHTTQHRNQRDKNRNENAKKPNFKPGNMRFQYGNYNQYYGYRNPLKFRDERMAFMKKEWFKERDVLDVGCNVGHLTLLIARDFEPRKIVGVDIDDALIKMAQTNIRHYSTASTRTTNNGKYPECMSIQYGPIHGPPVQTGDNDLPSFPNNVLFFKGNYVPLKEEVLKFQEPEYDVIMCMSVTKWIHLNWGDEGLINTFQRFFKQLRPGGKLLLEPQDWSSYKKKKKLTETIYKNFGRIKLLPAAFPDYLTKKVGFERVEYLKDTTQASKGFQRSIQLYHKPE